MMDILIGAVEFPGCTIFKRYTQLGMMERLFPELRRILLRCTVIHVWGTMGGAEISRDMVIWVSSGKILRRWPGGGFGILHSPTWEYNPYLYYICPISYKLPIYEINLRIVVAHC